MRRLLRSADKNEIDKTQMLLESRGIPVFVGNEDTARIFGSILPTKSFTLWVMLDEQYHDAEALLEDENHEVGRPVNVNDYYAMMEKAQGDSANRVFYKILGTLVLAALVMIYLIYLMSA